MVFCHLEKPQLLRLSFFYHDKIIHKISIANIKICHFIYNHSHFIHFSYYHLAKLLETLEERDAAIQWYEKGIEAAKKAGDNHALNELRAAYEDLIF